MKTISLRILLSAIICFGLSVKAVADTTDVMQQFKESYPNAQFIGAQFNEHEEPLDEVGTTSTIYGTVFSTGVNPVDSAWNNVAELRDLLGNEIGQLVPKVQADGNIIIGVMFDRDTETYKFSTFRFDQVYKGIPVFRCGVGFLVRNEATNPLVLASYNVRDLASFKMGPVNPDQAEVTPAMMDSVRQLMDIQPILRSVLRPVQPLDIVTSKERLVIFAGAHERIAEPKLALEFEAVRGSIETFPDFQKYRIVASVATGEIFLSETLIHNTDVTGNVQGRATDGVGTLECHPETAVPLPYAEVEIIGGNFAFADANGDFTIAHGGNQDVTVRSHIRGEFFEVFDLSTGGNGTIPFIDQTVTPPGPVDFLHNPTEDEEFPTANVNAYVEANVVRDFTLYYAPTFPIIANQTSFKIRTNVSAGGCNASYSGDQMNFYKAEQGCYNTAASDTVYHEYGHHLVAVSGNGQNQFGEGSGDSMAVIIQDDPIQQLGFFGDCNNGLRDARNFRSYPCKGISHDCGQLLSGCVWDLRNELIVTDPANYRDIGASLFINMLIVRGQTFPGNFTIGPEITAIYLELDDGQHCAEIKTAFGLHNMDLPELGLLNFKFPTGRPVTVDAVGGLAFQMEVIDGCEQVDTNTVTLHLQRGQGNETFGLSGSDNVFDVVFPAIDCGTTFTYYFSAETTGGFVVYNPYDANTNADRRYSAISATLFTTVFVDDFETDTGWTVSGDAIRGHWERGVPIGNYQNGPRTDGDGSGSCFLTQNTEFNSDVDNGRTIATSPVMDASGGEETVVSYYRWFTNSGNVEDTMLVEISNDGGSSWVELETVPQSESLGGWVKKTFNIADFVTPTSNVKVRFTAEDTGAGNQVEGAFDGVSVEIVSCAGGPTCAGSGTLIEGFGETGDYNATCGSDDLYWAVHGASLFFQIADPVVQFELTATVPAGFGGSAISVDIEASKQSDLANLNLRGLMFNFTTGSYVSLPGIMPLATTDAVQNFELPVGADPADFIESGTNQVRLLLQSIQTSGLPTVRTQLDQVVFFFE